MKISLISTVFNEENTIDAFLNSISKQTTLPDEVIITDAGSKDKTLEKLRKYQKTSNIPVKIIVKEGNRSIGRNQAIKQTRGQIIACSDAGCILDKNWLKNITKAFSKTSIQKGDTSLSEGSTRRVSLDVVSGYYLPKTTNIFEQCLSTYTCVMPDKIDKQNFLPSSRSIAFKKTAWEKVNGYPEYLDTCEDLVFAQNLKHASCTFTFEQKAIVFWPQRKNIQQAFTQFLSYAVGDGQAVFIRRQVFFLYFRYVFAFILILATIKINSLAMYLTLIGCFLAYCVWTIQKNYRYIKAKPAYYYLPLLQFTADIAVLLGTTYGYFLFRIRAINTQPNNKLSGKRMERG